MATCCGFFERPSTTGGSGERQGGEGPHEFDEVRDVVVVGYGAAGASAAIQAADDGADVLVVDRFEGGGATRRSGGVIYAGGGTALQRRHGFEDDPIDMYRYLRREAGEGVDEPSLRAFCQTSESNLRRLEAQGVAFPEGFYPDKATEPPDGTGLYYSGNEIQRDPAVRPAPRGHVPDGQGHNGRVLFAGLARAVSKRSIQVRTRTRATGLLTNSAGRVTGVVLKQLSTNPGGHRLASGAVQARFDRSPGGRRHRAP